MRIPVPVTADVSDLAGGGIALDARIRAVWRGARTAGPAFTAQTPPGEHLAVQRALEAAAPGDVIVIDGDAFVGRALWGDKMSLAAQQRGIAGLVVDGAVRDVAEIERLGFPVFAITSVPTGPLTDRDGVLGAAIMCGERRVGPGDLVVGDDDGVVVVPQAVAVDLMRRLAQAAETAGTAGLRFCACRIIEHRSAPYSCPESPRPSAARPPRCVWTPAARGMWVPRSDHHDIPSLWCGSERG